MTVQLRKFWWSSMDCRIKHTSSQSLTWPDLYIFPSTRCWGWNLNTLATWCKGLTHWKRPWCWERLKAAREGDDRGWDGWLASLTRWTWVRASGLGDGQGSPVCCSPWGRKKSDTTERLNWVSSNELNPHGLKITKYFFLWGLFSSAFKNSLGFFPWCSLLKRKIQMH